MPLSLAYWILMLISLIAGAWGGYRTPVDCRVPWIGWSLVLFLLLLIIGLHDFGSPIKG